MIAKLGEYRRAVGTLKALRDKNEGKYRGGEGQIPAASARLVQNAAEDKKTPTS